MPPASGYWKNNPHADDIDYPNQVIPKKITMLFNNGVVQLPPHSLLIVDIKERNK